MLADVTSAGLDPLAVRLAFLQHHYRSPFDLTWDVLRAADATLRRWRARVAEWSESPSAPMSTAYVQRAEAALDDDLDTPEALRVMDELEHDESVPAGAKFEPFLHLDYVLALDLPVDIGKPRTRTTATPRPAHALPAARVAARRWPAASRSRAPVHPPADSRRSRIRGRGGRLYQHINGSLTVADAA